MQPRELPDRNERTAFTAHEFSQCRPKAAPAGRTAALGSVAWFPPPGSRQLLRSLDRAERFPHLLPIVIGEPLDHRLEIAREDAVELVERQADAMVGQPVLGEVVGSDALAAVAGADERFALLGSLGVLGPALVFVNARLEGPQGLGQVLVLALFVLAGGDDSGCQVRDHE